MQSIRPYTLRQLLQAELGPEKRTVLYQNREVHHIRVVARVGALVGTTPMASIYLLDDTTAHVACFVYSPLDVAAFEGKYVSVVAQPRWLETKRGAPETHLHLDAEHVRLVTDFNEITHHSLDCIYHQCMLPPINVPVLC